MNPPSAIHGAMGRDRKPFTYTPGGLDLSEIKSERMAKRLMRNAMNEGVPQQPVQPIQSPPASTIAVPNFNCLPVQVFPAFNLPANPKSLLRTRSNPVSREPPLQRVPPPSQFVNNKAPVQYDTFNKNTPSINNNRPTSMFEYGAPATSFMNYGNDYNATFSGNDSKAFPEISYDAQYFQVPKINNYVENTAPLVTINSAVGNSNNVVAKEELALPQKDVVIDQNQSKREEAYIAPAYEYKDSIINIKSEIVPAPKVKIVAELPVEDVGYNYEQKQVKIVTKEVKKETKTEDQNGDQNGDTEAIMTVKLPAKKSAAKTETKVEVSRKTLPDGSVEEVKKTITKTTIDGKTEIKTKTETTIIPKDDEEEEEVEEEEEETGDVVVQEVNDKEVEEKPVSTVVKKTEETSRKKQENGQDNIIKTEERSETTTTSTKKVVIVQDDKEEEEEEEIEEEETEEAEPVTVVLNKPLESAPSKEEVKKEEETQVEEEEEVEIEQAEEIKVVKKQEEKSNEVIESKEEEKTTKESVKTVEKEDEVEEVEEEEVYEEAEEKEIEEKEAEVQVKKEQEVPKEAPTEENEESEYTDEEIEPEKEEVSEKPIAESKASVEETKPPGEELAAPVEKEIPIQKEYEDKQEVIVEKQQELKQEVTEEIKTEKPKAPESKMPLREPSVPLEKVEDVEIQPIGAGNIVTKSRTETTEIITGTSDKPTGLLTEYNRTENIVTVNRTTKTLDYENTQQTPPTLTYFTPHIEKFPPLPQSINRPYQPVYPSEPTSERRHSLLLERLSVERQIPTNEIYQNTQQQQYSQTVEQQNQWAQEPRVEILTIENVKPSSITNQQWYQQTDKKDESYNNVASIAPPVAPSWPQPKPQQQPAYQPAYQPSSQPTYQPPSQPAYQPPSQPTYQAQHQPKPVYQPPQSQPVYQTQPNYQPQPQYQPSYSENLQQNTLSQQNSYSTQQNYSTYTPKPTNWDTPSINTQNQYNSDSYQSTQQHSSSYVPPPWEQDSTYVVDSSQNYYQPPSQSTLTPDINQGWKPPAPKFTKTTPTAYIPPKPNQSFVKHVTISEPPKQPGRKTYYSEYERRYISVPESTYIPGETKPQPLQPQPDPSPAYYFDNNEPAETVEHEWRKELREFTEKAQTQPQETVKPPWENTIQSKAQTQYAKTQETTYTATPTWSQTLRPQSWRERSFESEFVSQEWPKTSTLGRGRPLSSYGKESIPERTRGVSVDRYNPNNYQSPVPEPHPPVQTFTHNPPAPHGAGYHNPSVPAYHTYSRASAEPREQPVYQQPRARVDTRASPFQSRSFKYLQWITGTDD